ncbi:SusD/RagB family nutrient-binding outer membrane lipoprotein [Dinghuibacter silviterrae]|uniref:SusD/RagB-like outer membrane lipoprotein n=1 Tax=Dinghuibacter silviterrae TaxID=1539049 RepID=A0A4R8DI08_9BACT|nr:SusD/RagB family nutrient-binding outer membrane lipoprotein [Dinghuibacter silviterrae]TDW97373.1 SusD/RagB-like outer membrane lipoprotein [Dinghuibacter silviterrae]
MTLLLASCTKTLESVNHDTTLPNTAPVEYLLTGAEVSSMGDVYDAAAAVNGYVGMEYAQYWAGTQSEASSRYQLDEGANNTLWSLYSGPLINLNQIIAVNRAQAGGPNPNQVAIAMILKAWMYELLTDVYGNIPYSQAQQGVANLTPAYDDSRTIYTGLVAQLDSAVAMMDSTKEGYKSGELFYNGNLTQWKRLAGSLKLRMGIRMADADPATAKTLVLSAVAAGVMQSGGTWTSPGTADDALFPYEVTAPYQNPFNAALRALNQFVVSSTLVNLMDSLQDPRLPKYMAYPDGGGSFKGKPYGLNMFGDDFNVYSFPDSFPPRGVYSPTFPGILMTYSEVQFDLAEAAARGYGLPLDAATYYAAGIKASMTFWGVTSDSAVNAYLARVPYNADDWRDCIGSQKWLALYQDGLQSWFERTRLDFRQPGGQALFIAPVAGSLDPTVSVVPYRLTYPVSEASTNAANYQKAAAAIGGDTKGTKLWWNKFN